MRRRRIRGIALVMSLLVVVVTALLTLSAASIATVDARAAQADIAAARALTLARAGVSRAMTELRYDYHWSEGVMTEYDVGGGTYAVSVWASPKNPGRATKLWLATSVGTCDGAQRTVQSWLQLDTFARYAYFTDQEQSATGQTIWFSDGDRITGEAHTNGFFSVWGKPLFSSRTSSANRSDPYFESSSFVYNQKTDSVTDAALFYHYANGYQADVPSALDESDSFSFQGGQPEIDLPTTTAEIKSSALLRFTGPARIVFNANGTMLVLQAGLPAQTWPVGTTVIHVEGPLAVSGVLDGRVTIGASGGIDITDNLTYKDRADDVLGLVAEGRIQVKTNPNVRKDIEVDATLMALNDSFTVASYDRGVPRGTLTVYGGIIQKVRGAIGTFSSVTNKTVTGYKKNYIYDEKLLNVPPPFFPANGKVVTRAFVDGAALGH